MAPESDRNGVETFQPAAPEAEAGDRHRVLVVDDDDLLRDACLADLRLAGYEAEGAATGETAIMLCREKVFDAAIVDLNLPGMDGLATLKALKGIRPDICVIIVTGFGTIPSAIEAMRLGASDYVTKPVSFEDLETRLRRCAEAVALRAENAQLRGLLREKYRFDNLVGKSEAMQEVFRTIEKVSRNKSTVLILGRSGTGKEMVARAIHFNGPWSQGPLIAVDCAAISPTVIESELFGHVKGAFTGALTAKDGLFRAARGGTLFLDEIGDLPLDVQTKFLRALQEREVRPVGSDRAYPVDVRVIAASNRDLEAAVRKGEFREDLYYRLNVVTIKLPDLAERRDDIPLLAAHFVRKHGKGRITRIAPDAMEAMLAYNWPGNVRELENAIERAVALGVEGEIKLKDMPESILAARPGRAAGVAATGSPAAGSTFPAPRAAGISPSAIATEASSSASSGKPAGGDIMPGEAPTAREAT
ncbi:MAG: sigma-54 dependent transcriptional regulator, partial [Planctomycetota bacterium]|nr:sigma-54 dependent transcriptional regulator [Planctomycetota bacterium]